MRNANRSRTSRLLPKAAALSLLLLFACRSFAVVPPPPPPPPPPKVDVTTGDPGDPDPGDTATCSVTAGIENAPVGQNEATLVGHWSWTMGTVTVTPYDGGSDSTADASDFHVTLNPISDPGKPDDGTVDDTNPNATFTGTFRMAGYYLIPVTATVHFVDKDTGADAGTFSNTDYVGDSKDNPAYDPSQDTSGPTAPGATVTPNTAGDHTNAPAGASPNAPAPPPPPPPPPPALPKRIVSGFFVKLPNPIKLGLHSKNATTQTFLFVVSPALAASSVSFKVADGVASATPHVLTGQDPQGHRYAPGTVQLVLVAAKPSTSQAGNTLTATKSGKTAPGTAQVLVLDPTSVDNTPPFNKPITGQKVLENSARSPGNPSIVAPEVGLFVIWGTTLAMQVRDQFGQPLDGIFAGTDVSEQWNASENAGVSIPLSNINSPIGTDGTYLDTVNFAQQNALDPTEPSSGSGLAQYWSGSTSSQPNPFPAPVTQRIHVFVGGTELKPSPAVKRKLTLSAVDNVDGSTTLTFKVQAL